MRGRIVLPMTSQLGERTALVGNRLVLAGSVIYLLEWVAIVVAHLDAPLGADVSAAHVASSYAGNADVWGWAAGWFSIVLLGRLLIMTGLRSVLADSGRPQRVMDLAVATMTVSVAVEISTYAVVAGASWYVDHGGSITVVRGLDAATFELDHRVFAAAGASAMCAGAAMWASGLFPRVLSGLGLVGGFGMVLSGLVFNAPKFNGLNDTLSSGAALFWIWMLWTGVLCWRATPGRASSPAHEPGVAAAT
jgi:hypothetical protein